MHAIEVTLEDGFVTPAIVCTGTADAPCHRRPPHHEELESWTNEEATIPGFDCMLVQWAEGGGFETIAMKEPLVLRMPIDYEWEWDMGPVVMPAPPAQPTLFDSVSTS